MKITTMHKPSSITPDIPLSPFDGEAPDMFFGLPMAMARAMALRGERIGHDMGMQDSLPTRIMRNIVATHHERGDGSGYPRGLTMADIPLEGRIVAVADVYDALINRRAYKESWDEAAVALELQREVDAGQLDGDCVAALMAAREARAAIKLRFADVRAP